MKTLSIATNEIKQALSNKRTLVFLLAFPICLMLILGLALSNAFNSSIKIEDFRVLYLVKGNTEVEQAFQSFIKEVKKNGVQFTRTNDEIDAKKAVKENKYVGLVEVTDQGIQLYENNANAIKGSLLKGMLKTFADKVNLATTVAKTDPGKVQDVLADSGQNNYVQETSINSYKEPHAMDYYAVAMTNLAAFFGMMSAVYLIRGERQRKTDIRLSAAPISKMEILSGKVLGGILTNVLCMLIIVLVSKWVFKASWGDHLAVVFLVLLSEVILAVSLGVGISYMIKTDNTVNAITMVFVQVAAFFGGSYFPIDDVDSFGGIFTRLSPLYWANNAINKVIYLNDMTPAVHTMMWNLGIAVLFLLISVISMRRREGL